MTKLINHHWYILTVLDEYNFLVFKNKLHGEFEMFSFIIFVINDLYGVII